VGVGADVGDDREGGEGLFDAGFAGGVAIKSGNFEAQARGGVCSACADGWRGLGPLVRFRGANLHGCESHRASVPQGVGQGGGGKSRQRRQEGR